MGSVFHPDKTYAPLIIDTNRPLTGATAFQFLKSVTGRFLEIAHSHCRIDGTQLAASDPDEIRWKALWALSIKENHTASILEASDRHPFPLRIMT
jgi:hypothetical protein